MLVIPMDAVVRFLAVAAISLTSIFSTELWAQATSVPQYLNQEYQAKFRELPTALIPPGSFFESFKASPTQVTGSRVFIQSKTEGTVDGAFVVVSESDGSLLSTGQLREGRVFGNVSMYSRNELVYSNEFKLSNQPPIATSLLRDFEESPKGLNPESQRIVDDFAKKSGFERGKVRVSDLMKSIDVAASRAKAKITGREMVEEFSVSDNQTTESVPSTPAPALAVSPVVVEPVQAQDLRAPFKEISFLQEDSTHTQHVLGLPSGADAYQNPELEVFGSTMNSPETIELPLDNLRGPGTREP